MFRVTRVLQASVAEQATSAVKNAGAAVTKQTGKGRDQVLQKGARRDPELYVCPRIQKEFNNEC